MYNNEGYGVAYISVYRKVLLKISNFVSLTLSCSYFSNGSEINEPKVRMYIAEVIYTKRHTIIVFSNGCYRYC